MNSPLYVVFIQHLKYFILFFQNGIVALNFAFEEEAETFLHCAKTTVANRNRRREGKRTYSSSSKYTSNFLSFKNNSPFSSIFVLIPLEYGMIR